MQSGQQQQNTRHASSAAALERTAEMFSRYRGLLFSIAYRMLGSASDAEDIVQEAFVRWLQAGEEEVRSPKAYLSTVVVRLCMDHLRSARARREVYTGPWLPEPIPTEGRKELVDTAIMTESLSFAFLVMLENLSPLERAVFLLREVFDYDYPEIASIVGKSEANCRQVLHRARRRVGERRPRFEVSRDQQDRVTRQFLSATAGGDVQSLLNLLAPDVVYTGDGGGKAQTALKPVEGREKVVRGTLGGLRFLPPGVHPVIEEVNGQPAIVVYLGNQAYAVLLLHIEDGLVRHVYATLNPDKLRWLDRHIEL